MINALVLRDLDGVKRAWSGAVSQGAREQAEL